jgi:putative flippase GtrA
MDNMMKNFRNIIVKKFLSAEFIRFLLVGGSAALANFLSGFFFQQFFSYRVSIALAFTVGSVISFIFNKLFTFKAHDEKVMRQLVKFTVVAVVAIFLAELVAGLVLEIYRWLALRLFSEQLVKSLAHVVAIGVTTIFNYLAMKFFSFRSIKLSGKLES